MLPPPEAHTRRVTDRLIVLAHRRPALRTLQGGGERPTAPGHLLRWPHPTPQRAPAAALLWMLRWTLPAVPVTAFALTFIACYVVAGVEVAATVPSAARANAPLNPALPFVAALVVSGALGTLCLVLYLSLRRVVARARGGALLDG